MCSITAIAFAKHPYLLAGLAALLFSCASCTSLSPQDATLSRLKQTQVDEIRFQRAHIDDVLSFLVQASRESEPKYSKGIGIVYMDHEETPVTEPAEPGTGPFGFGAGMTKPSTNPSDLITLELRNVSLYQALTAVCDVAGVEWRIDEHGILLLEK